MSQRQQAVLDLDIEPLQATGLVTGVEADTGNCRVLSRGSQFTAARAPSCLLCPQQGDKVYLAGDTKSGLFVVAILEREHTSGTQAVMLPPSTTLSASEGELTLDAQRVTIKAPQLNIDASNLAVKAPQATFFFANVRAIGGALISSFTRIELLSDALESFVGRLFQFARHSTKTVEGIEQVQAAHLHFQAQETAQIHARHLVMDAEQLLKADADQIHLG